MRNELISAKTRAGFREAMTFWVLRQIDEEFLTAGLHVDPGYSSNLGGQRRGLVDEYYHAIDFKDWNDVQRLLRVYESVLDWAAKSNQEVLTDLLRFLERDGFVYRESRIVPKGGRMALNGVAQLAEAFDAAYVRTQVARIEASIDNDPALAIGSAKELVETCCKTILTDCCIEHDDLDIPQLVKLTTKQLKLTPEDVPDGKKASEAMRRMLSSLANVAHCLAELRNIVGTGHGPDGKARGPRPRHARLAVGAATTLAMFLFETYQAQPAAGCAKEQP